MLNNPTTRIVAIDKMRRRKLVPMPNPTISPAKLISSKSFSVVEIGILTARILLPKGIDWEVRLFSEEPILLALEKQQGYIGSFNIAEGYRIASKILLFLFVGCRLLYGQCFGFFAYATNNLSESILRVARSFKGMG